MKPILHFSIIFSAVIGVSCTSASDPETPIVQKFVQAGGGDPHSATVDAIQGWFMNHQPIRAEFDAPCAPLVSHYPNANWITSAEGKICMAEGRAKPIHFKDDGFKM